MNTIERERRGKERGKMKYFKNHKCLEEKEREKGGYDSYILGTKLFESYFVTDYF